MDDNRVQTRPSGVHLIPETATFLNLVSQLVAAGYLCAWQKRSKAERPKSWMKKYFECCATGTTRLFHGDPNGFLMRLRT
jgi:hypothetical protein